MKIIPAHIHNNNSLHSVVYPSTNVTENKYFPICHRLLHVISISIDGDCDKTNLIEGFILSIMLTLPNSITTHACHVVNYTL